MLVSAEASRRFGDVDPLEAGELVAARLVVRGEALLRKRLPSLHVRGAPGRTDDDDVTLILVDEVEQFSMVLCSACVKHCAELATAHSAAHRREHLRGDAGQATAALRNDEVEQCSTSDTEGKEELLDPHLLVANGVEALGDEELPGEAGNGVLVDADRDASGAGNRGLRELDELRDRARRCGAHQAAEGIAAQDAATAGQPREAHVTERVKVKDALNAEDRFEEQREDEATTLVRAESGEARSGQSVEANRLLNQSERASVAGASRKRGVSSSASSRRQPRPYRFKNRRNVSRSMCTPKVL